MNPLFLSKMASYDVEFSSTINQSLSSAAAHVAELENLHESSRGAGGGAASGGVTGGGAASEGVTGGGAASQGVTGGKAPVSKKQLVLNAFLAAAAGPYTRPLFSST